MSSSLWLRLRQAEHGFQRQLRSLYKETVSGTDRWLSAPGAGLMTRLR